MPPRQRRQVESHPWESPRGPLSYFYFHHFTAIISKPSMTCSITKGNNSPQISLTAQHHVTPTSCSSLNHAASCPTEPQPSFFFFPRPSFPFSSRSSFFHLSSLTPSPMGHCRSKESTAWVVINSGHPLGWWRCVQVALWTCRKCASPEEDADDGKGCELMWVFPLCVVNTIG